MSEETVQQRSVWDLIIFIAVPTIYNVVAVTTALLQADNLPDRLVFTSIAAGVSCIALVATFVPAFNSTIADRLAFFWLLINGVLLLVLFALIHNAFPSADAVEAGITTCGPNAFWNCFYFSIVTFTTLGYGDFQPAAEIRLLAGLEALMGYVFLGFVVAIANDWMRADTKKAPNQWDFPNPTPVIKSAARKGGGALAGLYARVRRLTAKNHTDNGDGSKEDDGSR